MFLAKNKALLAEFKKGDRKALDEVFRHYEPGVRSFLRKGFTFRGGGSSYYFKGMQDESDLDNCVQEVFRRAFEPRAIESYNGINSFTNWVLAIARNMVINRFRNREVTFSQLISAADSRSHLKFVDDIVREEYSGLIYGRVTSVGQDRAYEQGELKGIMSDFVADLTPEERELLQLRFAQGIGQEEAAKATGSTRMKVRTTEAKLRGRLRAYLRHTGYIDDIPGAKKKPRRTIRGAAGAKETDPELESDAPEESDETED